MRKLSKSHGMYAHLPALRRGEMVRNQGRTFQLSDDGFHVNEMRYDSYPTLFGTGYAWFPDGVVYQLIGNDLYYDPSVV